MATVTPTVLAAAPQQRGLFTAVLRGVLRVLYVPVVLIGSVLTSVGCLLAIGLSHVSAARS